MSYENLPFHPRMEKVVDILRKKTQNDDTGFFRLMVSYYFAKVALRQRPFDEHHRRAGHR
jgi:hypothetical protein